MKKFFLVMLVALMSISAAALERISFVVSLEQRIKAGNGHPKSPIQPPTVYIEDYTLTFQTDLLTILFI